jgi:hypothetical protein
MFLLLMVQSQEVQKYESCFHPQACLFSSLVVSVHKLVQSHKRGLMTLPFLLLRQCGMIFFIHIQALSITCAPEMFDLNAEKYYKNVQINIP